MLEAFRSQVRQGLPLDFSAFGLKHSAYAEVVKQEAKEKVIKKRDYMKDVII
jgi:hypothetical protein